MSADGLEVREARDEVEVEAAKKLRLRVFTEEQGVPRDAEIDGLDPAATHVVALRRGTVVAACRLRYPQGHCKLERMVVDPNLRRTGIGSELLAGAERQAARQGATEVVVHAQREVEEFWAACGYRPEGETFLEEGIPHVQMRKRLSADREPA